MATPAAPQSLVDAFLERLPAVCRDVLPADPVLDAWLAETLATAQAIWPQIVLSGAHYAGHVASKVAALPAGFAQLRTTDLFLACACLQGDPAAAAVIENEHLPELEVTLARLNLSRTISDDLKSQLREQLFVGREPAPALLHDYSGRGALLAWLRSIAVHAALKVKRRETREVDFDRAFELAAPEANPELAYLKRRHAADFKASLERSFTELSPRERNLLRQHYLDGLTIDQLGVLYHVHRATAARWVVDARKSVLRAVKKDLVARLSMSEGEIETLWAAAQSELEASISRLLGPGG